MAQADPLDRKVVVVSASQTLPAMATTQAALLEALSIWNSVVVDCSGVTEVDVSFVQTLIAGHRHAQAAGKHLALSQQPSGALLLALTRGGFLRATGTRPVEEQAFWQLAECGS